MDIIGNTYGILTVLEKKDTRKTNKSTHDQYLCKCACGNDVIVSYSNLTTGNTKSCGCLKNIGRKREDLKGKKYGLLVVKERDLDYISPKGKHKARWICKCDCGNTVTVYAEYLKNGHTKSCGCLQKDGFKKRDELSFIGRKFGYLTVYKKADTEDRWICICKCGNECVIKGSNLVTGTTKSCGCLQKERASQAKKLDITNKKYGKLRVIRPSLNNKFKHTMWLCKCDCGGVIDVETIRLRSGITSSCGCIKSKGEEIIKNILKKNGITYKTQYIIEDCRYPDTNRPALFDFGVINENNSLIYLIEYDGKQHFSFTNQGWNTRENTKNTIKHDIFKNQYCIDNKIQLIRIPYWNKDKLIIDDLKLETSSYVVKNKYGFLNIEEAEELIAEAGEVDEVT